MSTKPFTKDQAVEIYVLGKWDQGHVYEVHDHGCDVAIGRCRYYVTFKNMRTKGD